MPANFYQVQELRRERSTAIAAARGILETAVEGEDARDLTQEEQKQWDAHMARGDELRTRIEREERMIEAESQLNDQPPDGEDGGQNPLPEDDEGGGEHRGNPRAAQAYRDGFGQYLRRGQQMSAQAARAMQVDVDELGGFLVAPPQMVSELLTVVDDETFIRQWARTFTAQDLGVVTRDDDLDDFEWTTELKRNQTPDKLKFGRRALASHPARKRVKISRPLVRRAPNVVTIVNQRLGYKYAVTLEKSALYGNGVRKPLGVFVNSPDGITATRDKVGENTNSALTPDGLISAKFHLKASYQRRAKWLFHRNVVEQMAKFKDNEGQYIWRESTRVGEPDKLLGLPLFQSEFAPNTFAPGAYMGILGDWQRGYWVLDPMGMQIQVLDQLYAEENMIGYIAEFEGDGQPVLEEAFVRVQLAS